MASTNNTSLKELNIKLFNMMEAVKRVIEGKGGIFFYPFRESDYQSSGRSINNGFIFPGDTIPYVRLYRHKKEGGHYHLSIEEKKSSTYSAYLGFYDEAAVNMSTDFPSQGFGVKTRNYLVKDAAWDVLIVKTSEFIYSNREIFLGDHFEKKYNKKIKNVRDIVQTNQDDYNTDKDAISDETPKDTNKSHPLNLILYGPPGTGKTYNTVNRALEIILKEEEKEKLKEEAENAAAEVDTISISDDYEKQLAKEKAKRKVFTDKFNDLKKDGRIEFITFHQSMSYEDFVEGIKPIPAANGKNVIYNVMPGIFKQICEKAQTDNGNNYVLIIDEINRGNVSQIFGELITLIEEDKRLGNKEELKVKLPYSSTCKKETEETKEEGEEFGVPNNLYIIGTMNTADRSVEALDTALRRRFSFEEMMPKYADKEAQGIERVIEIGGEKFELSIILKTINQRIEVLKGREQQIGHSYLMKCRTAEDLKLAFKDKIVPLLQEYFYGDYSQIGLVLGQGFVKRDNNSIAFADGFDAPDQSEETYCLLTDSEWEELKEVGNLKKALNCLLNIQENKQQESKPNETNDNESN